MDELIALFKSAAVNRIAEFAEVAKSLDVDRLVAAYGHLRNTAPRRHAHDKQYFVDHAGPEGRSDASNRREEHLALALFDAHSGSELERTLEIPTGQFLRFLDYQTPLKAKQGDAGIGKVDLFGVIDGERPAVVELKVRPVGLGLGNTPLLAYLEALAYCAIVEANANDIAIDAHEKFGIHLRRECPALVVMAPEDYWQGFLNHPKADGWWPIVERLSEAVGSRLSIETHFLALRDVAFEMGTSTEHPRLTRPCSVLPVSTLHSARG